MKDNGSNSAGTEARSRAPGRRKRGTRASAGAADRQHQRVMPSSVVLKVNASSAETHDVTTFLAARVSTLGCSAMAEALERLELKDRADGILEGELST